MTASAASNKNSGSIPDIHHVQNLAHSRHHNTRTLEPTKFSLYNRGSG